MGATLSGSAAGTRTHAPRRHFRAGLLAAAAAAATLFGGGAAQAQTSESVLIQPVIPMDFDRDRNVSVRERLRPDYDPIGIRSGGFNIYPSVQAGVGFSDNAALTGNGDSDGYVYLSPQVRATSDWSRHQVQLLASARLLRYFDTTILNQNTYDLGSLGRFDLGSTGAVTAEARITKLYESPTEGQIDGNLAVLSHYQRSMVGLRGEYSIGRIRFVGLADATKLEFEDIELPSGGIRQQFDRDRTVLRVNGRTEYAVSPSFSVYGQVGYDRIGYQTDLATGAPNRDSDAIRGIAGVSMDLEGFLRGVIGIGYTSRKYDSPLYRDVDGFSAAARLEYFFSPLTTFTATANRSIQDSAIGASSAYFDNRFSLRADHELLRNLILTGYAEYAHLDYIDEPLNTDSYRLLASARYLSSRTLSVDFSLGYTKQDASTTALTGNFNELRAQVGVTLQR